MSNQVRVEFKELITALSPLEGLKVFGVLEGPPTRNFPLRELVEELSRRGVIEVEGYRDISIGGLKIKSLGWIIFHCKSGDIPDDFALAIGGEDAWDRLKESAEALSRKTKITFTHALSAILHGIQGAYIDRGEDIYIIDVEEVADETADWLPEFFQIVS